MQKVVRFLTATVVVVALAGCESTNYDGVYIGSWGSFVLVVDGDKGKGLHLGAVSVKGISDYKVSYSDKKMFLDSSDGKRSVLVRGIDEISLQCLDCRGGIPEKLKPHNRTKEEIYKALDERKKAEAAKAKAKEEATKAQAERQKKYHTLAEFDNDWVLKRHVASAPLAIMSITTTRGVKLWSFKYDTAERMAEHDWDFRVDGNVLTLTPSSGDEFIYKLSDDGQKLICQNCGFEDSWIKADRSKIKDINYARSLAGKPAS